MEQPVVPVEPYLRRIGVDVQTGPPTAELLAALQLAHLVAVPFENLHVYHRRGQRTDVEWSYRKIVEERRGGWCFEANGAFGALLRALGFGVDYVSCRVWESADGSWGPEFDHLGLVVRTDDERFFVDVGFGDCCIHPLRLGDAELDEVPRRARTELVGDEFVLTELVPLESGPIEWEPQLRVDLRPRTLAEFAPRSRHLATDPSSSWHQKPFATRALDGAGSRVTLRRGLLRRREGTDAYVDENVEEGARWGALLEEWFGLRDSLRP